MDEAAVPRGASGSVAACDLCGRATYDAGKRERPWARGVSGGRQVLVCPACQSERQAWAEMLERCPRCGSTRLSAMLGEVVCRSCGAVRERDGEPRRAGGSGA